MATHVQSSLTYDSQADRAVREYFRYLPETADVRISDMRADLGPGFFRFGEAVLFGTCNLNQLVDCVPADRLQMPDVSSSATPAWGTLTLPFDPTEVADNLRFERYPNWNSTNGRLLHSSWIRKSYYGLRRYLPVGVRKYFQRAHLAHWRDITFPAWPVDCSVDVMFQRLLLQLLHAEPGAEIPFIWFWPHGYSSCVIMTHDIEQEGGRSFCSRLMDLDEGAGIHSSFQVIPEGRYEVPESLLQEIRGRGHEVNVHDLNHDGQLFTDREEFLKRVARIAEYKTAFAAKGFRSGVLYRNLDWYDALDFEYDMSVPNVAHLDPQRGGCCTVMPYFVGSLLELPLTTTQDYSLFNILNDYSLSVWEQQIETIRSHHGLISFNIHPDYIQGEREMAVYIELLRRIESMRDKGNVWQALPREVNSWWRRRAVMELVKDGATWRIRGAGSDQASVAIAYLENGCLQYRLTEAAN